MSGRRSRALKAMDLNRGDRRRAVRASTSPSVLARMHKALDQRDRKRLNGAAARDKRRWHWTARQRVIAEMGA